jgi:hypothetical protein
VKGNIDKSIATYATYELILNPFKYSEVHNKKPIVIKSKASFQVPAQFIKALNIVRDRNPFLDFMADVLSVKNTISGGIIDITFVTADVMTSNGPEKFLSLIPIVNAWQSSKGKLSSVQDIVFYNSTFDVPLFFEVDNDVLTPIDCPNIYGYELPHISYEMKDRLLKEGYEVELKHFTIENISYKALSNYKLSGNYLFIKGVKPFGGLATLKSNDSPQYQFQFTPLRDGRYPFSQYRINPDK